MSKKWISDLPRLCPLLNEVGWTGRDNGYPFDYYYCYVLSHPDQRLFGAKGWGEFSLHKLLKSHHDPIERASVSYCTTMLFLGQTRTEALRLHAKFVDKYERCGAEICSVVEYYKVLGKKMDDIQPLDTEETPIGSIVLSI